MTNTGNKTSTANLRNITQKIKIYTSLEGTQLCKHLNSGVNLDSTLIETGTETIKATAVAVLTHHLQKGKLSVKTWFILNAKV